MNIHGKKIAFNRIKNEIWRPCGCPFQSVSPVTFDPSSALRGAGGDEGAGRDGVNGGAGPRRDGVPPRQHCGTWRVTKGHVEGAFHHCVHDARTELRRHKQEGGMAIYDVTGDAVFSTASQSHFRGPERPSSAILQGTMDSVQRMTHLCSEE